MTLRNIPDPRMHDWMTWVDAVVGYNPRAARVMEAGIHEDPEMVWRSVADVLTMIEPTTPRHDSFPDWREWAISLMSVNAG